MIIHWPPDTEGKNRNTMVKKKNIYTVDLSEVKDKVETSKTIHIHIYKKK